MDGFSLLVVRLLLASLGLLIVSAAPTADLVGSVRTTTEKPGTTETDELEFKDVPIYEKDKPLQPAPPGSKYVAVLKCNDDAHHVAAPNDGHRSQDKKESHQSIHDLTDSTAKDVPKTEQINNDKEQDQTANVPAVESQQIVAAQPEKSTPLVAEAQLSEADRVVDLVPVESTTVDGLIKMDAVEDGSTEPVPNTLVETGKIEITVPGNDQPNKLDQEIIPDVPAIPVKDAEVVKKTDDGAETGPANAPEADSANVPADNFSPGQEVASVPVDSAPVDLESQTENGLDGFEIDVEEADGIKDFTGYKVYRITIPTEEAARWILKFEDVPGIEFWADPKLMLRPRGLFVTSAADMLVAPDVSGYIEEALGQARLPFEILITDVQEAIRNENPPEPANVDEVSNRNGHRLSWERYHTLDDIDSYLAYLKVTFRDFVTVTEIGKSTEGRPIKAIKLHQNGGRPDKKNILIDAGIHAREWITPATITYMIKEIIENPQKYECIMNEFDWIFVPVLNPDGYHYTHTNNRMWRKTRSRTDSIVFRKAAAASLTADRLSRFQDDPILDDTILEKLRAEVASNKASLSCTGADANRNFDYHWLTGGSSRNPCSETFAGPKPFSEPEARALRDLVLDNKDQLAMYISLHAYSQMWLLPWGYKQEKPEDYSDLYSLAKIGSRALETVNRVEYMIGSIPDLLYVASGSSIDWVKGAVGVKYAYTLELRDSGRYGFILPANQILPSGKETWNALYATAVELSSRVYTDSASCPTL